MTMLLEEGKFDELQAFLAPYFEENTKVYTLCGYSSFYCNVIAAMYEGLGKKSESREYLRKAAQISSIPDEFSSSIEDLANYYLLNGQRQNGDALFRIIYFNYRNKYGPSDPKTIEAAVRISQSMEPEVAAAFLSRLIAFQPQDKKSALSRLKERRGATGVSIAPADFAVPMSHK